MQARTMQDGYKLAIDGQERCWVLDPDGEPITAGRQQDGFRHSPAQAGNSIAAHVMAHQQGQALAALSFRAEEVN